MADAIALGGLYGSMSPPQKVSLASHDYAYITDYNSNSYDNNTIFYDSIAMALNGLYVDPSQSYIIINHRINAKGVTAGATSRQGVYDWVPKHGFPFLYSAVVQIDNQTINNNSPSLNMFASYTYLREWTRAKCRASGAALVFWPDDIKCEAQNMAVGVAGGASQLSIGKIVNCANNDHVPGLLNEAGYSDTTDTSTLAVTGAFSCNTLARSQVLDTDGIFAGAPSASVGGKYPPWNEGMWQRALFTRYPGAFPLATQGILGNNTGPKNPQAVPTTSFSIVADWWQMYPLRVICDAFDKVGLMKSRIQIQLFLNKLQKCTSVNCGLLAGNPLAAGTGFQRLVPQSQFDTCPVMLNYQNAVGILTSTATYSDAFTSIAGPTLLFLKINRLYPEQLMQVNPEGRVVFWNDYSKFTTFYDCAAGTAQVNWNITSGVVNARKLLIWKFPDASAMGSSNAVQAVGAGFTKNKMPSQNADGLPPAQQLCCTEPWNSTPLFQFGTNTQLLVGTTPLYQYPVTWTWLNWLQTQVPQQWHMGTDSLITEDLITKTDYDTGGIESFNLIGARLGPDEVNNVQLQLQTTLYCPLGFTQRVMLNAFVVAEKAFHIDPAGVVVQMV